MNTKLFFSIACIAIASVVLIAPSAHAQISKQQLITNVLPDFISVFGNNPTETEKAWWRARVSCGEITTEEKLISTMQYTKSLKTRIGSPNICGKAVSAGVIASTLSSAVKQQLIINVLPDFIKIFGNNPTDAEKAWWRARISCGEITSEEKLSSSMQYTKLQKKRIGSPYICGKTASTTTSTPSSASITKKMIDGIDGNPAGDTVRIGITNTNGSAITVTANNNFQIREGADKILANMKAGQNIAVSWSAGKYHVRGSGKSFETTNKIRFVPLNGAIMQIVSYSDPSLTYAGKNYNRFRGVIEIRKCDNCNQLWAINELRTELYLRGLGETSGEGPEQYVEALGIAARTYVLYHKIVTGGRSMYNDFDITNTPNDQIYRGYEYEIITPRMSSLFNKVRGIILTNKEQTQPIAAIYFSDSDGHTRTAKQEWGTDRFPYLQRSVADPYHVATTCNGHCVGMSAQGAYGFAKAKNWTFQQILTYYFYGVKLTRAY